MSEMVCEQKSACSDPPFARMFWPGDKARVLCFQHALMAQIAATAMGFHLVVEAIPQTIEDLTPAEVARLADRAAKAQR